MNERRFILYICISFLHISNIELYFITLYANNIYDDNMNILVAYEIIQFQLL